ncbi:Hypothetical predicted protein [Pelobates cultripes]|uniref:Uncharacterized protein n=1 Tax=Pelobates cultripes TaxID=61616 RepID=A0AAD1W179_PELCU|nr:Hypothetical predicted protein [Pelobates cultripes]
MRLNFCFTDPADMQALIGKSNDKALVSGRNASNKAKHSSKTIEMDGAINLPPRKRATSRAKSTRLWKGAKAQLNSESELSDIGKVYPEFYM